MEPKNGMVHEDILQWKSKDDGRSSLKCTTVHVVATSDIKM
jgi:hypothetical protein